MSLVLVSSLLSMGAMPPKVMYWSLDKAIENDALDYAAQALTFALQGIVNERGGPPRIMFEAGLLDFDWPKADPYWRQTLESDERVSFTDVEPSLCELLSSAAGVTTIEGAVLYEDARSLGTGYTMAMALTLSGQERLLPITEELLSKHACLASLHVVHDLRLSAAPQLRTRESAWQWAIAELLPKASKDRVFNLYHYTPFAASDPQSNATLGNLDLAVQTRAFVMDLDPADPADLALISQIFLELDPLFDAYGWAHDEHAWTEAVSRGGGVVFCSFASPNLSFWALLALPSEAGGLARNACAAAAAVEGPLRSWLRRVVGVRVDAPLESGRRLALRRTMCTGSARAQLANHLEHLPPQAIGRLARVVGAALRAQPRDDGVRITCHDD